MSGDGKDGAFWTEARIATLREFAGKISAAAIANIIGATRNMIIGKMRRLGLVGRAPVIKNTRRRKTPFRKPKPASEKPTERAPHPWRPAPKELRPPREPDEQTIDPSRGIELMELTNETCRWPLWSDRTPTGRRIYCGDPAHPGPYCGIHSRMAWQPKRR